MVWQGNADVVVRDSIAMIESVARPRRYNCLLRVALALQDTSLVGRGWRIVRDSIAMIESVARPRRYNCLLRVALALQDTSLVCRGWCVSQE